MDLAGSEEILNDILRDILNKMKKKFID